MGKPWHGVLVATALPMRPTVPARSTSTVRRARARGWRENGCDGVARTAPGRVPGADRRRARRGRAYRGGGGAARDQRHAGRRGVRRGASRGAGPSRPRRQARRACMLLPPNAYRADERAVVEHYREVAPGRPADRRVQQPVRHQGRPDPGAAGAAVRRGATSSPSRSSPATSGGRTRSRRARPGARPARRLRRRHARGRHSPAPSGWVAGYPNALPDACVAAVARRSVAGDLDAALPLYRALHPLLRWDSAHRVRPGDQAVDGPRRPLRRRRAGSRACRCCPSRTPRSSARPPRRHSPRATADEVAPRPARRRVAHRGHADARRHRRRRRAARRRRCSTAAAGSSANSDDLRTLLMYEPRGHAAMSGAILQPPTRPDADWGVALHRGQRVPADVRPRHDRGRDRAGRDRHGRGDRAGHHDPARHPGRPRRGAGSQVQDGRATAVTFRTCRRSRSGWTDGRRCPASARSPTTSRSAATSTRSCRPSDSGCRWTAREQGRHARRPGWR